MVVSRLLVYYHAQMVIALGLIWLALAPTLRADDSPAILVIGDSHFTGPFGPAFDEDLHKKSPGARISIYASSSATPNYFFEGTLSHGGNYTHVEGQAAVLSHVPLKQGDPSVKEIPTPLLPTLLDQLKPSTTVVALGANNIRGYPASNKSQIDRTIEAIQAHHSRCIWVGPPDERFASRTQQDAYYDLLRQTIAGRCALIDSRKFTEYPPDGGDGIHYNERLGPQQGVTQARSWALGTATKIGETLKEDAVRAANIAVGGDSPGGTAGAAAPP